MLQTIDSYLRALPFEGVMFGRSPGIGSAVFPSRALGSHLLEYQDKVWQISGVIGRATG